MVPRPIPPRLLYFPFTYEYKDSAMVPALLELPGVGNLVADAVDDEIPVRLSSGHSAGEGSRVVAICPQICSSCWQGLAASGDGPDLVAARRCRTRQGAA